MNRSLLVLLVTLVLFSCDASAHDATVVEPVHSGTARNPPTAQDALAIGKLLDTYTQSVSTGNRAAFESQLLDLSIPFSYVQAGDKAVNAPRPAMFQDYAGFKKVIFDSGKRYQQRFSHIQIEQVGNLAQVSLDYQTALQGSPYQGTGWKVMQLIKLDGQWKIASEFFTGYADR